MLFAVATPAIGLVAMVAINHAIVLKSRSSLQSAADSAALAGASSLNVPTFSDKIVQASIERMAASSLRSYKDNGPTISTQVDGDRASVTVSMSQNVHLIAGALVGMSFVSVSVKSVAKLVGGSPLCLVTLDRASPGAMHLEKNSRLVAPSCAAISNSNSPSGLQADAGAYMLSSRICSAGGFVNNGAVLSPTPGSDCVPLPDPLSAQPPISYSSTCMELPASAGPGPGKGPGGPDAGVVTVTSSTYTLNPGTYCGGLHISGDAQVTLSPGIYIIKDGPLVVDGSSSISGQNVGFYFVGNKAGIRFDPNTTISLTAPALGDMAGFLFREDLTAPDPVPPPAGPAGSPPAPPLGSKPMRRYDIRSNNARNMLGTIYLPVGRLTIGSKAAVADQSAYTVIVVQQLDLFDGPDLHLNTNYSATTIPVPAGVGPTGGATVLTQ